ncbi:MAG: response regulator transcription factor [Cytophagales bacterium]|nr:response regulator transcription factor [Cytophagales bacterium]
MEKIKILIADDHQVVRKGIATLLEDEPDIEIVGEAADGFDTIEKIKIYNPNIVLLDIAMPKLNGLETAEIIEKNHRLVKSLIFSMHNDEEYIIKAVESGAWGYILKDTTKDEMLNAIRTLQSGQKYFSKQVSNVILEMLQNKPRKAGGKQHSTRLTKKEKHILKLIVSGLNSREIAQKLELSIRTVDNHRAHIMKKTGVKNAVELVKLALKENLVQ